MTIDPIGDMLTRIRNAIRNRCETVEVPSSKIKEAILKILKDEHFIADYKVKQVNENRSVITINLRYDNDVPAIHNLERVSRPGLRVYTQSQKIPRVLSGLGLAIISTPQGLMTGKEARRKGTGGEVICRVW